MKQDQEMRNSSHWACKLQALISLNIDIIIRGLWVGHALVYGLPSFASFLDYVLLAPVTWVMIFAVPLAYVPFLFGPPLSFYSYLFRHSREFAYLFLGIYDHNINFSVIHVIWFEALM